MKRARRAVNIIDVAKAAGVSVSTVSRVLNARADVADDTQERVLSVIGELGYTSSLAARSMRSHRKNLIGLVVPDIGWPYSIEVMKGINRAIAESTFDLLLYTAGDVSKPGAASHEQHYVSLYNSIADGVLIVASAAADFTTQAPVVSIDPHGVDPSYPFVQATNYEGARDAMQYLLDLGHRRIAFITGRPEIDSGQRRLKGYRDALASAGLEVDEQLIASGDFSTASGHTCALDLLSRPEPPTAIFAANDQSALGVYQAAAELGVRIPDDCSLLGFDNIPEARYVGLTTVDQFLEQMGYVAVQMLTRLIDREPLEDRVHCMPTELVIRTSCQPPPGLASHDSRAQAGFAAGPGDQT
jgi:LacI family transcriptional regulator